VLRPPLETALLSGGQFSRAVDTRHQSPNRRLLRPGCRPSDVEDAAQYLARTIHVNGAKSEFQLPKLLSGMSRRISIDDVVAYAVAESWLVKNGQRIIPGDVYPELQSAFRYVPAPVGGESRGIY
jgi:hypothetical protein